VVVAPIDDGDVDIGAREAGRGAQAAEARTDDDDMGPRHGEFPGLCAGEQSRAAMRSPQIPLNQLKP
jgi:hypothetical protein